MIHLCHKCGVESPRFNPLHPGDCTINFCRACFILHESEYDDESFDFQRCPCGQLTDVASTRRSSSHETIRGYFCKERARNPEKGGVLCSSNRPDLAPLIGISHLARHYPLPRRLGLSPRRPVPLAPQPPIFGKVGGLAG